MPSPTDDPYSRLDYRRLIAWPARIERERPFLESVLSSAPSRRLLDLGCGTGEHARFLASLGFEVVGIDASPENLGKAEEGPPTPGAEFLLGDLADVASLTEDEFGGGICLGNTLPHVTERADLERAFSGLRRRLLPGGPLVIQLLNYDKIFLRDEHALPLSFREHEGDRVVFLRLMEPGADGELWFNPTTLRYRPGEEPPVEVMATKNVRLKGWRSGELEGLLEAAGFVDLERFGGMQREPYVEQESSDLVLVAR